MLEDRIKRQASPLSIIPDEHKPLIVKLAHESDRTLAALSKHIRHELLPTQDDEEGREGGTSTAMDALPLSAVETAIKSLMRRNNYGLDGIGGGRVPAAVCVWRWEVKDQHRDWLPKNARDKAEGRLAERIQATHTLTHAPKAKQDLLTIFQSLSKDEQEAILDPKGTNKLPQKEINSKPDVSQQQDVNEENNSPQSGKRKEKKRSEEDNAEQEKLDKKAAKAEKEKKEKDAQNKSRSIMANFFARPKNSPTRTPLKAPAGVAGPSKILSDFEKSFKPFVLKKDTELAPVNWFVEGRKCKKRSTDNKADDGVIVIDTDDEATSDRDVEMLTAELQTNLDVATLNTNADHLRFIISSLPPSADPLRRRAHCPHDPRLKTYNPHSVRDIVSKLSEAEIAGDTSVVRSLLSHLNDRSLLPAKVFIFSEDVRPGYYGTWTRNSRIIGPRTPFAQDVLVFDYGYDSGEEWEEEPVGDADDVVEDGEDEEDGDDPDSDADSWLVDDDDEPDISLEDLDNMSSGTPDLPPQATKRKAEDGEKKLGKKRKVVIPLVPFAKGPCWETTIGQCEYNMFDPYRIQLFNDTPYPINPFTFISTCIEDSKRDQREQAKAKPVCMDDGVFVVPDLPERLNTNTPNDATVSTSVTTPTPAVGKKVAVAPKTPFPDAHLPLVLEKITSLQAGNIGFLVEAIYRDLREHKVKKNIIEAKVREVGEKCKEKKFWVVKPGIQTPA
ncbi:hypothetical protein H0H81_007418 [Sphagnurus paluster]|uniref:Chromatin assembly factor 1 subunit A dimerization domain-containing protein n=1 Tax=Sphagnurus paluster TaxID=117069 RepID=A0A9P7KJ93_9AGAR|nr:hypothetical protein H0H81_007418 [Sphagnurus paluster]